MRRPALVLAALLLSAGASLGGVLLVLSPTFLTSEIADSVARATGKTLTFGERPRLILWPEPGVSFRRVRLSDRQSAAEPFADIERMVVKIGLSALLGRRAELEEIRLINPLVNLSIDRKGHSNWVMAPERGKAPKAASEETHSLLPRLYIEGGRVNFADDRTGGKIRFERLNLMLTLGSIEGPLDIKGSADWRSDRVSFSLFLRSPQLLAEKGSPLDLNVSGTWLNFAFSGRGALKEQIELAGTVQAGARSVRQLMRWAGLTIGDGKGLRDFHTIGAVSLKGNVLSIEKAEFGLDGMKAQGEAALRFAGVKPRLDAKLDIEQLDLNRYLWPHATTDGGEGIESWSTTPIDHSLLNAIEATAALRAKRVSYGEATMTNAAADVTIGKGSLSAKLKEIEMYGGSGSGQLVLNSAQRVPTAQLSFQGRGFDGLKLLGEFGGFKKVKGRTELAVALAATGRSAREMVASLRGTAGFEFRDGAVKEIDLSEMVNNVSERILTGWMQSGKEETEFELLKANFQISDGIAESKDMLLKGPKMQLKGTGIVDLLKCEIDFKVEPETAAGNGGLAVPVLIKGPWAKPKFYPDIAGVLENPQAAYEALKMLLGKGKQEQNFNAETVKGENAGGVAGEVLEDAEDHGSPPAATDMLKKQIHTNTLDLMNSFASGSAAEPISPEQ
ncbi:MAG TPA: AsmA family protein [Aestuariivirgaceae bacterium]|jgi:AsmA protein